MKQNKTRRSFLKNISLASMAALTATGCNMKELEEFFQRNFRTLSDKEKEDIIKNLEQKYKQKYNKEFQVSAQPAMEQVEFAYALDLSRCVGCRKCVYACVDENNQSRSPQIHWIQVLQMEKEKGIDFAHSDVHYNPEKVPEKGHFYLPVPCQQ